MPGIGTGGPHPAAEVSLCVTGWSPRRDQAGIVGHDETLRLASLAAYCFIGMSAKDCSAVLDGHARASKTGE